MTVLGIIASAVAICVVGLLAHRSQEDERLMGRILAFCAIYVALTLAYTIATGEFLGWGSGAASESDTEVIP